MEKIVIENIKDGEVVSHPLLLLSGNIRSARTDVTIWTSPRRFEKISWPVVNGAFKSLVFLRPGENIICLECTPHSRNFRVVYKTMETSYFVRLIYIVCRNDCGRFQAPRNEDNSVQSACHRLCLGARMIQTLTAEKIRDYLPERRTFKLEEDNRGEVVCHVFRSDLTKERVHAMTSEELWNHFAVELMQSELNGGAECKFLAFLSATEYRCLSDEPTSHADILNCTKGYVALGGGGLALFGTGCLHTWAQNLDDVKRRFADVKKIDRSKLMDDSCNRGEHWACFSTGLGATLHELAHTFDLGHTREGIMGLGFHDTFKVFTVLPLGENCSCFSTSEMKKREPNHYKVSLIHNIKWSSASNNNNRKDGGTSSEGVVRCLKRDNALCCVCRVGASWTRSCAILLYYHKWFNPSLINSNVSCPPIVAGNKITSDVGIRIIEIRDSEGMLLTHKEYLEGNGRETVVLDLENDGISESHSEVLVVAEDSEGNIVKKSISFA